MRLALPLVAALALAACTPDETPTPEAEPAVSENYFGLADPYTRAAPAGGVSAVFVRIENTTASADTLIAARTDASDDVQIHQSVQDTDGLNRMAPAETVPVPPGQTVALEPGGLHIMLLDLQRDLTVGDSLLVEFDFAQRGTLIARVPVRPAP